MRNVTEIQQRLIETGYLPALNAKGETNADGKFGHDSLDAYNHFRATMGKGPLLRVSMDELNADLFPTEQPAQQPPRSNPLTDFLTGLAIKAVLSNLKGLPAMAFLTGYKTYIIGILMILTGGAAVVGITMPGGAAIDPAQGIQLVLNGLGLIFLRGGVAKIGG